MSAGGSGAPAEGGVSSTHLLLLSIIGGLIGIYLTPLNSTVGPVFGCLGAVCAIVGGADAIRRVASYGLGTGVPSIGYMSLGIGVTGALAGVAIVYAVPALNSLVFLGPIFVLVFSAIIGLVIALVARKIVGMKIPVMERCTTEIAIAAGLSVLGFSAAIAGSYNFVDIADSVIATGFIGVFYIINTLAIQHPFNACLGPNEDQVRTLKLAVACGFISMVITGILAMLNGGISWLLICIVGLIGWVISFKSFVDASFEAAASVKWAGLWPKVEE